MNERIRELAEQAGMIIIDDEFSGYGKFAKKFAELIVQDCIDIISPYTIRMGRPGEEYLHPISEIKKNFGVK